MNAVEILVLHYLNAKDESYELNQSFWKERYSANINKIVNKLVKNDYIKLDVDTFKALKTLKVNELKEVLKKNSLPVSGKKVDLIDRIQTNADPENYKYLLKKIWLPTEKGNNVISSTEIILYAHRKLSNHVTIVDVFNTKKNNPELNDKEVLILSLEKSFNYQNDTSHNNRSLVFPLWEASKVCRHYEDYFGQYNFLIRSCVSNFNNLDSYQLDYLLQDFDYFVSTYKIPEVITNDLQMILSSNDNFKNQFNLLLENNYKELHIESIFSSSEIKESITASMEKDEDRFIKIYKTVFKRAGGKPSNSKSYVQKENKESFLSTLTKIYNKFKN